MTLNETKHSPEEVSEFLLKRMQPKKKTTGTDRKKKAGKILAQNKKDPSGEKKALSPYQIEQGLKDLDELIVEKSDLMKQIASDEYLLGVPRASVTQDEVLNVLDDLKKLEDVNIRSLISRIEPKQVFRTSIELAQRRLTETVSEIENLISNVEIAQAYRERMAKKVAVVRAARNVEGLNTIIEKAELAKMALLARRNDEHAALTGADTEAIKKYDLIQKTIHDKINAFMSHDETYYEAKRRTLLKYRQQLLNDGFVETDSVRKTMINVVGHLQIGIPVLLRGHLGVGKTEIALHASRKYFRFEPEFISGSEEATKYDMYGKTQIGIRSEEDKLREFRHRMEEYARMNKDLDKKTLEAVERQYYQTIVVQGITTSFFQYGPLVRALQQGKPLLIDEMDGIPHSIIIRLNHVLTRRPGDVIRIEENSGDEITVQKGFCVLATGNIKSARYKREELDAAFLSRWWSHDVEYIPQDETYEILVASLLDGRGNLQVKRLGDLDDLKRLTEAASEIQQIFTGEHLDYLGEGADVARQTPASLKKSVLSLRHLWNIVRPWKARNFDRPLEYYVLNEFIKPAVAEDQLYLLQLLCRYRFFKTWKVDEFGIPGLTKTKLLAYQGQQAKPVTG